MKLFLILALLPLTVYSQQPACTACHGQQGEGTPQGPPIAGQPQLYLERQMQAYAEGARQHPVMSAIAKALSPEERRAAAAHFAKLAPKSASASSAGATATPKPPAIATRGNEAKQVQACQNCHGPGGAGVSDNPYLAGLPAIYFESAMAQWKSGARNTDPSGQMPHIAKNLSDAEVKALAAYFARQPAPQRHEAARRDSPGTPTLPGAGASGKDTGSNVTGADPSGTQGPGGGAGSR